MTNETENRLSTVDVDASTLASRLKVLESALKIAEDLPTIGPAIKIARCLVTYILETIDVRDKLKLFAERAGRTTLKIANATKEIGNSGVFLSPSVNQALETLEIVLESIACFVKKEAEERKSSLLWRKSRVDAKMTDLERQLKDALKDYQLVSALVTNSMIQVMYKQTQESICSPTESSLPWLPPSPRLCPLPSSQPPSTAPSPSLKPTSLSPPQRSSPQALSISLPESPSMSSSLSLGDASNGFEEVKKRHLEYAEYFEQLAAYHRRLAAEPGPSTSLSSPSAADIDQTDSVTSSALGLSHLGEDDFMVVENPGLAGTSDLGHTIAGRREDLGRWMEFFNSDDVESLVVENATPR